MEITLSPVAFVRSPGTPVDDRWGGVISTIDLAPGISEEAFLGIEDFSHLEILFHFHQIPGESVVATSRHPRNNPDWPKVGIFAQRGALRPNRIGATVVQLLEHNGRTLRVSGLDAIDGTPIIDIKPIMKEFLPVGNVRQPGWSHEVMRDYWSVPQ